MAARAERRAQRKADRLSRSKARMSGDQARQMLQKTLDANLAAAEFEPSNQPFHSGWCRLDPVIAHVEAPTSWLGGLPEMPSHILWPESEAAAALFVGQIALTDLPADIWGGLGPKTGWLLFFLGYSGKAFVIHTEHKGAPRAYLNEKILQHFGLLGESQRLRQAGLAVPGQCPPKIPLAVTKTGEMPEIPRAAYDRKWELLAHIGELDSSNPKIAPLAFEQELPAPDLARNGLYALLQSREGFAPDVRSVFEEFWTHCAGMETGTMSGAVGQEFWYDAPENPVLLMRLPTSDILGWQFDDVAVGIFIAPDDLKNRNWDKAWYSYAN